MVNGKFEESVYKVFSRTMQNIYDSVLDHTHVVNYPINNVTIIIRDENNEKMRVGKLMLQISI